jgi:hypothetical protein
MTPRFTSGCPSFAVSAAYARSQASISSHPPPSANPFTAAITGKGARSIASPSACPAWLNA